MFNHQEIIILLVGIGTVLSLVGVIISLSNLFKNLKTNHLKKHSVKTVVLKRTENV